jgi:phage tail sheath protein FI
MPEYLAPGVYVEEVDTGVKTIEGVSTSVAGFVGMTRRGTLAGLPQFVTSFADFARFFGGFADFGLGEQYNALPYAVDGFFANGGKRLFVKRVASGATKASKIATGGMITRLQPGANAATGTNQKTFTPLSLRGIQVAPTPTKVKLVMVKNGVTYKSAAIAVQSINEATGVVTLAADLDTVPAGQLPAGFDAQYTSVLTDVDALDVTTGLATPPLGNIDGPRDATFTIRARDEGSWGKGIVITAAPENGAQTTMDETKSVGGGANALEIPVTSTAGFYKNAWVELNRGDEKRYFKVVSVDPVLKLLILKAPALTDTQVKHDAGGTVTVLTVCEFRLTATFEGVTETYGGLTLEAIPGRNVVDRVNNASTLIEITAPVTATDPFAFPSGDNGAQIIFDTGGVDGAAPADADFVGGGLPGARTGIKALEDIDEISIIAAPGLTGVLVQNALIEQCERLKDRFAVLDPRPHTGGGAPDINDIQAQRGQYDTKYAALYYPRLIMNNPLTNTEVAVPPSGHMAGIYARVDIERGVHKAPANEVVRDILGFEIVVNKETQELLNPSPRNINVFRDFRADSRGLRIWGARCITSDTEWKYINVRRLFIFLEESLDQGTQWVVFEPNDEKLWARVTQSITAFLTRVWHDGALMGTKAEEAFFVKCDRSTMTQDDLDNGRLIVLIGVAPVKPAEFVIIRIGQFTASAQNQ